ncbi:hypothetical protein ACIU1J_24360 [Azospirillum doebereinerae]|uniref:hypothetical protein n=1 Tax=Azospirillum doebereinerae TaxID=92933 RepID=UPI00384A91E9
MMPVIVPVGSAGRAVFGLVSTKIVWVAKLTATPEASEVLVPPFSLTTFSQTMAWATGRIRLRTARAVTALLL